MAIPEIPEILRRSIDFDWRSAPAAANDIKVARPDLADLGHRIRNEAQRET